MEYRDGGIPVHFSRSHKKEHDLIKREERDGMVYAQVKWYPSGTIYTR